jgi:Rod binding domain-containing protein
MKINPAQLHAIKPLGPTAPNHTEQLTAAREARQAFRDFVGQTFFGQMLKSMRSTQGKPAYFHGGQTEEIFRSQLDQTLAEHMTEASADQIADPMFRRQFPREARVLAAEKKEQTEIFQLADLDQLRRR